MIGGLAIPLHRFGVMYNYGRGVSENDTEACGYNGVAARA